MPMEDALRESVIDALGAGARTKDDLRVELGLPSPHEGRDELERLLLLDGEFAELADGFVHVPTLLDQVAFTVPLPPQDVAKGFVRLDVALAPLEVWVLSEDIDLIDADGEPAGWLEVDERVIGGLDSDVVLGPDGWLDGMTGQWAAVRVIDGALSWAPRDAPPAPTAAQLDAVRTGFHRAVEREHAELIPDDAAPHEDVAEPAAIIFEAVVADRAAFVEHAVPPLPELFHAAGLDEHDGVVAGAGFDWDEFDAWRLRRRLSIGHRLDERQVEAAWRLIGALGAASADARTLAALDDAAVARAVWFEHFGDEPVPAALTAAMAVVDGVDEPTIGVSWLRARLLDRLGDPVAAVASLEASIDDATEHRWALIDLAGFRADAGDAGGSLRLLQRAHIDPDRLEDEDADLLQQEVTEFSRSRPRPGIRRNDRCWCDSGRKYKACHLGRDERPLEDRAVWLYDKAVRFLRNRHPLRVADIATAMTDALDDDEVTDALWDAVFTTDIALHEDGIFDEFLAARHAVLPDDEALLASQWALVDRSVYEIVEVGRDRLRLRDIRSGDHLTVVEIQPLEDMHPGVLAIGRPLPVGDSYRAFGGFLPVPPGWEQRLLVVIEDGDAEELASTVGAMYTPPHLTNTESDEFVPIRTKLRVPDPATIPDRLATIGMRAHGDSTWTLVWDSENGRDVVAATARFDGTDLIVETNSIERAFEVAALLRAPLEGAEVVDVEVVEPTVSPDGDVRTPDDPVLRAALADFIATKEREWLDESIPALGGRTPREAAADPVGREDLTRMLAAFPEPEDGIGAMSPTRLRAALGLDD